jgi:hypothetical protein
MGGDVGDGSGFVGDGLEEDMGPSFSPITEAGEAVPSPPTKTVGGSVSILTVVTFDASFSLTGSTQMK